MKDVIALSEKKTRKPRTSAEVKRYGHAEGTDRSANFNVVEYAVRDMFKGKSISAAAKATAKKFSGFENWVFGPGVTTIDPKALETALWDRMAEHAVNTLPSYKAGKEHWVLGGTLQFYRQKPTARTRLKALIIEKLGRDPFTSDDGT